MINDALPIYRSYNPNPRQKLFHEIAPYNPRLIKLAVGGLGSGKSTACEQEQSLICLKTPGGKSIACRKSLNRSDTSLIEDYQGLLQGVAKWISSKKWFEFKNGHKLMVVPSDEWDRFGSTQIVSFYIQEAQEVDYKIFDTLTQRLRDPAAVVNGIPYFRGYMCARGVKREHWLYKDFVLNAWNVDDGKDARTRVKNPDYAWMRFKTWDNQEVLDKIAPGYIDAQIQGHKDQPAWIKMLIEGEFGFDIEGRPVYECYRPEKHDATIVEDPSLPILRGWDFGYNRPAVVWCQYTREGRLLVLREYCPTGIQRKHLFQEVAALQRAWFPSRHDSQYRDYGDATGDKANDVVDQHTIDALESFFQTSMESRRGKIQWGLETLRNLMTQDTRSGKPRFAVDFSCERLREALAGAYYYNTDKTDERPVKGEGYDDVCDALRYVAQLVVEEDLGGNPYRGWQSKQFASYR